MVACSGPGEPSPPPRRAAVFCDKDGREFELEPLRTEDRADLERFYREFEPKRVAQGLPPSGEERLAIWLDSVLPVGIHILARREGALIGHALLVPTGREGVCEYAVFLRQDVRGRGVGTELNRAAVTAASAGGLKTIWLCVAPHNRAAIRSYEKVGFRFLPATIYSPEAEMELQL